MSIRFQGEYAQDVKAILKLGGDCEAAAQRIKGQGK